MFYSSNLRIETRNLSHSTLLVCSGCGFLETVVKLVELGANLNARDVTDCTPLQNAAHGTYSALAAVPAAGAAAGGATAAAGGARSALTGHVANGILPAGNSVVGVIAAAGRTAAATAPLASPSTMTVAQAAAQSTLAATATTRNGMVPVRTGLAWATLGEHSLHALAKCVCLEEH